MYTCNTRTQSHTVFIRILAAATINFSLAGVQLLFEGGYKSGCGFYLNKYIYAHSHTHTHVHLMALRVGWLQQATDL